MSVVNMQHLAEYTRSRLLQPKYWNHDEKFALIH